PPSPTLAALVGGAPPQKSETPSRFRAPRRYKAQLVAFALNRLDKRLAPAAETDNRRINHGPTAEGSKGAVLDLAGRGTKVRMVEIEHLVPAVDRLLVAVVWAIMGKERVSGAVIAVELVVLAEPFQLGLGAVDLVGGWIWIFVTEQAQQRAIDPLGQIDRRDGLSFGQP